MTNLSMHKHFHRAMAVAGLIAAAVALFLALNQPSSGAAGVELHQGRPNAVARASAVEGGFQFAHLKVHLHHHGRSVTGKATFAAGDTGELTVGAKCSKLAQPTYFHVYGVDAGIGTADFRGTLPLGCGVATVKAIIDGAPGYGTQRVKVSRFKAG